MGRKLYAVPAVTEVGGVPDIVGEALLADEVDELLDEPDPLCSSHRLDLPGAGSANQVVLHGTPPLNASIATVVHVVPIPKRTVLRPVKGHNEPSFAQNVHDAVELAELLDELAEELDVELLELDELLAELLDELDTVCSSHRLGCPVAGSANQVVLHRTPPLTASRTSVVHLVPTPNRTVLRPEKEHKAPSFAQNVHDSLRLDELLDDV